ncbi:BBE domain-containing protein [Paraburkholderia sp. MM5496-R1]|uniref:BBE domain-containing protein n=1 Tax=unclassified Paraburkholderia TaxID=2615204 RepID=UPI003D254EAA
MEIEARSRLARCKRSSVRDGRRRIRRREQLFPGGLASGVLGGNSARLLSIKQRYDPHGVFFVRHGVGSEDWSDDGFTRMADSD